MSEFVIIAGLSGAGRSQAADVLEDLGWYVIDNLPPLLIPDVANLTNREDSRVEKVALVVGPGPYQQEILPAINMLRLKVERIRILFLDAATEVLVRRYESTKRSHAFVTHDRSLAQAIEAEREVLQELKAQVDVVVDTSELNVHQLRSRITDLFVDEHNKRGMNITVLSFGYKHGLPLDTDLVFDCRFLPNPYWNEDLRHLTGLDERVREYVMQQESAGIFLDKLHELFDVLLPAYEEEGKAYLTLAFGCTGGHHRSVTIAEKISSWLTNNNLVNTIVHRDIHR